MRWTVRDATPDDHDALLAVWRRAVEATHHFLTPADVDGYETRLRAVLPRAAMRVAVGDDDVPVGFLAGRAGEVDALFVDPAVHGTGAGTALVDDAARHHAILTVAVNEQNPDAHAWYRRRGFVETHRSDLDADGRPFPLVYLRRAAPRNAPGPAGTVRRSATSEGVER